MYHGTNIQWARTTMQVQAYLRAVAMSFGVTPQIAVPDSSLGNDPRENIRVRWKTTESFVDTAVAENGLQQRASLTMLDVGGIGSYRAKIPRYTCYNVDWLDPALFNICSIARPGLPLPYSDRTFDLVVAESALHHAASHAPALVAEMVRVSANHVMIVEDVLEHGMASADVRRAYRRHDPNATYRPLAEWMGLARRHGLHLRRLAFLHRVPIHVQYWATKCDLGFAPMVYMLWSRSKPPEDRPRIHVPRRARRDHAGNVSTQAVRAFLARRREEERRANLTYCNKVRCRDATLPFPRHSWYNRSRRRWNSRNQGGTKQ